MKKNDVILQAQSGSGKTATYAMGTLHNIDPASEKVQILALVPVRELGLQVHETYSAFSQFMKVECHLSIGGTDIREERKKLKQKAIQVVVGTPGRVLSLLEKGTIPGRFLKILVIDEADKMLDGFLDSLKEIFTRVPNDIQIVLASATMPKQIVEITRKFMKPDKVQILLRESEVNLKGIKQFMVAIEKQDQKLPTLLRICQNIEIHQGIIFTNRKEKVSELVKQLKEFKISVQEMSSDLSPAERIQTLKDFKNAEIRLLVSTDLYARGIDVHEINIVFNYDMPENHETYIHRVGRTGRFGRQGMAISFVEEGHARTLCDIEKKYSIKIEHLPLNIAEIQADL